MQANPQIDRARKIFEKYLPYPSIDLIAELIYRHPLDFHISKPRKTKLGDFRFVGKNDRPQITVNGNLNPYSFFITTVHELAHFYVFLAHGRKAKAHGEEWKKTYRELLQPFLELNFLPKDIESALINSLISVKASSCSDPGLFKMLKKYVANSNEPTIFVDDLPFGSHFGLNEMVFEKGKLRRKRYECLELNTKKKYLVSGIAQVIWLKKEEN